jgi:hypothetical protein
MEIPPTVYITAIFIVKRTALKPFTFINLGENGIFYDACKDF